MLALVGCAEHGAGGPQPDAAGPEDRDGDGIPDQLDNCADTPNPSQDNVDADRDGDACDGCPLWITDDADRDGDGVLDTCDPHPDEPGDRIVLVERFRDLSRWQLVGDVTPTLAPLHVPPTLAPLTLISRQAFEEPTVELFLGLGDEPPSRSAQFFRVWTGATLDSDGLRGVRCGFDRDSAETVFLGHLDLLEGTTTFHLDRAFPTSLEQGNSFRIFASTDAAESACLITDFDARPVMHGSHGVRRGQVAIDVLGMRATIMALVIYAREPRSIEDPSRAR